MHSTAMFGRLGKLIFDVVSGSGGEGTGDSLSSAASASASEPAKHVENYSFDRSAGLAGGAAAMMVVGFCESPVAGKYFVADARSVSGSGPLSGSGSGVVFSFNARRQTVKPVYHTPKHHTMLWFGAVGTTATRYAAYMRLEDGSGVVFILQPAIMPKGLATRCSKLSRWH